MSDKSRWISCSFNIQNLKFKIAQHGGSLASTVIDRRYNAFHSKLKIQNSKFKIAQHGGSLASTVIDRRYKAFHSKLKIQNSKFKIAQHGGSLASTVIDRRYNAFHLKFKIQHSKLRSTAPPQTQVSSRIAAIRKPMPLERVQSAHGVPAVRHKRDRPVYLQLQAA
jgi:hypothetical protein